MHSPLIALAALWATLWSLISLVEIPAYIHDPAIPWWQPFVLVLVPTGTVLLWLTLELRSARYLHPSLDPPRAWFLHQLRRFPLLAIGYFVVSFGTRHAIFALAGARYWHLPWSGLIPYELVKLCLFYCLWLGLVFGTLNLLRWREQGAQLARTQKALADAQLAQLQSQLRPHFLFNALNTISSLMQTDVGRADRVLTRLGDLLRASLGAGELDTVSLQEELHLLRMYAEIMQERYADRVVVSWQIADDALGVQIPAMLLQPLLENSFKHGIERTTGSECIRIVAARERGRLNIEIHNSGSALHPGWCEGIGLTNCRERLRVRYGDAAQFGLSASEGSGVTARISLPLDATDR
jgi:sensor histidine kinase YesM